MRGGGDGRQVSQRPGSPGRIFILTPMPEEAAALADLRCHSWLIQEELVGVKCGWTRGCLQPPLHHGSLVRGQVVALCRCRHKSQIT